MNTNDPSQKEKEEMPSHYEKTQLGGRPFVVGIISFFVFMALVFGVVWMLLQHWSLEPWPQRQPPAPASADVRWNTQMPQVQIDPGLDLARVRRMEDQRLHALRWNDAAHTYATIPIEDAMKLMTDAAAKNELSTLLPAPLAATPLELQDQKSRETAPPQVPNP
jgi:hypothetical protein